MKLSLASALPVAALLAATLVFATAALFLAITALFVAIALLATALLPPTTLLLAALLFRRGRLTWLIRITLCFHLLPLVIANLLTGHFRCPRSDHFFVSLRSPSRMVWT